MAGRALQVTWGVESKVFSVAQLEEGVNLAAEFMDNPFAREFASVDRAVRSNRR